MKTEISISMPDKLFRGDSLTFECQLNLDLEDYKIRCELFDQFYSSISLATENAGGSDDEIEIIDAENGQFNIYVEKDSTLLFHLISYIEIEIEDDDEKIQTVYFAPLKFEDDKYWSRI